MAALGVLASGEMVFDRLTSHMHIGGPLLREALRQIRSGERDFLVEGVDLGRVIGHTTCVETGPEDEVVYALREKRRGLTRFVKNRASVPARHLTVVLKRREEDQQYVLITAFVGQPAEPEPWDAKATDASRQFWATHALVAGSEPVVEGTTTTECPW